jgi:hypothetical protein
METIETKSVTLFLPNPTYVTFAVKYDILPYKVMWSAIDNNGLNFNAIRFPTKRYAEKWIENKIKDWEINSDVTLTSYESCKEIFDDKFLQGYIFGVSFFLIMYFIIGYFYPYISITCP